MKKVVKWILYGLIICAILTLSVCRFVIPEQTALFLDKIIELSKTPVAIAGISTTIGGIFIFVITKFIFTNSKFGKKELEKIKNDVKLFKEKATEESTQLINKVDEYKEKFELLKEDCDNKVTIMYEEFNKLESSLLDGLKAIPNKKVQDIVMNYEKESGVRKKDIIEKTIHTNEYVNGKVQELTAHYEEMFKELCGKVEVILNEKAEDDKATKE